MYDSSSGSMYDSGSSGSMYDSGGSGSVYDSGSGYMYDSGSGYMYDSGGSGVAAAGFNAHCGGDSCVCSSTCDSSQAGTCVPGIAESGTANYIDFGSYIIKDDGT